MQNPFDMYSIQDIIYTTRPDLLIETGGGLTSELGLHTSACIIQ